MAINLSDNIKISANLPIDSRYFNNLVPYTGTTQVNAIIPEGERHVGLTVNILSVEYWYETGTLDTDLVMKKSSSLTGATNGIMLINGNTEVTLGGPLTSSPVFNGGVSGFTLQYASDYTSTFTNRSLIDKGYADAIVGGLKPKAAVAVATQSNVALSGLYVVDGLPLTVGMRVLVKNQTSGSTNGVYIASMTAWERANDFDGSPFGEVVSGSYMWVLSGETESNTSWVLTTPDPIVIDTTPLHFVLFGHVADIIAGPGIDVDSSGGTHTVGVVANNGLTSIMSGVKLGGTLTDLTVINDSRTTKRGIEYGFTETSGFTNNSLITKGFVESLVSSGGTYNLDSPSVCLVGGMPVGTVLTDKTAFEILSEILVPVVQPTISPEYSNGITLSPGTGSICEIGYTISTLSVTSNFNRGGYSPVYCGGTPYRTGLPNTHTFTGTGVAGSTGSTSLSVTKSTSNYVVVSGPQGWSTNVAFDAGQQAKSSKGLTSTIPAVNAGNAVVRTASIFGAYPVWGTTSAIGSLNKQPIANMTTGNDIQLNLVAEATPYKQIFQIPCAWLTSRPLKGVCQFNTVSNAWEFPGGTCTTSLNIWTPASASQTIQGNSVGYCEYTFNGVDRSNVSIRLVF